MEKVKISYTKLRQNLAECLNRVESEGVTFEVYRRSQDGETKVVAILAPVTKEEE